MVPENEAIKHLHYVLLIIWIVLSHMLEKFNLNLALLVKSLLVPDNLEGTFGLRLMIKHFHHLAKGASSQNINDLISVVNMFTHVKMDIVSVLIVISIVRVFRAHRQVRL